MHVREDKKAVNPMIATIQKALRDKNRDQLMEIIDEWKSTPAEKREEVVEITCLLLSHALGVELFCDDEEWYASLTVQELNELDSYGRTAISLLCRSKRGCLLLDENESLRRKITYEGMNAGKKSRTAAYQLLVYSVNHDLLLRHSDLKEKISSDVLNEGSISESMPIVYELSKTKSGVAVMLDPIIRQKITAEGLNVSSYYHSSVNFMTKHPEGLAMLADDNFRLKIQAATLNLMDSHHCSALSNICQTEEGCEIIAAHADLRNKINAEAFNSLKKQSHSPLYLLAKSPAGRRALLVSKHLRKLIDEDALNSTCRYGEEAGYSALFWLLNNPEGREIFLHDRRLREMIRPGVLLARVEGGVFAGTRLVDVLMHVDSVKLLRLLSREVQEVVDRERYDHPDQTLLLQQSGAGFFQKIDVPLARDEKKDQSKGCVIC